MHTFVPHTWNNEEAALVTAVAETLSGLTARLAAEEQAHAAHEAALRALGLGLEYKDRETLGHTDRVTEMALRLGRSLGLNEATLQALRWGSYLHDVGKMTVPDAVLLKPAALSPEEWVIMRGHVEEGERFADILGFLPGEARAVIAGHHERWDGQGYPRQLRGEAIPLVARIFAVCDVYDALTSVRPYKRAWSKAEALAEITSQSGHHFDPQVCQVFLALLQADGLTETG